MKAALKQFEKKDWIAIAVVVVVFVWAMVGMAVRPAEALTDPVSVMQLATGGPLNFICYFIILFCASCIEDFIIPILSVGFQWSTDFITIPYVNAIILSLQGFAAVAVICVRVAVGIKDGIFLQGGDREKSLGEYMFKSITAILLVAAMPMLCRWVIVLGNSLYVSIAGTGGDLAAQLDYFHIDDTILADALSDPLSYGPQMLLWFVVGVLGMMVLAVACCYQFIRRQIEMITVSIVAPLVSIYAATENESDKSADILKRLFGLTCMQWLQYVLVQIAFAFGIAWIGQVALTNGSAFYGDGVVDFMFALATFAAALTIPSMVDQYTFGSSGSRVGSAAAVALATGALRMPGSAARNASRGASRVANNVGRK